MQIFRSKLWFIDRSKVRKRNWTRRVGKQSLKKRTRSLKLVKWGQVSKCVISFLLTVWNWRIISTILLQTKLRKVPFHNKRTKLRALVFTIVYTQQVVGDCLNANVKPRRLFNYFIGLRKQSIKWKNDCLEHWHCTQI